MKAIPNCITFLRLIFSLLLLFTEPLSATFFGIYIFCGLSDIFDGIIARKAGLTSRLGEKLDSFADLVMTGTVFVLIYPVLKPETGIIVWAGIIALIRLVSMAIAFIKYRCFAILHTYGNKIAGLSLFLVPLFIPFTGTKALLYTVCAIASVSAAEELMIQVSSRELEANRRSIFVK